MTHNRLTLIVANANIWLLSCIIYCYEGNIHALTDEAIESSYAAQIAFFWRQGSVAKEQ